MELIVEFISIAGLVFILFKRILGKNKLPIRTQEQVLRDSSYPEDNRMPSDFWGLKPPI